MTLPDLKSDYITARNQLEQAERLLYIEQGFARLMADVAPESSLCRHMEDQAEEYVQACKKAKYNYERARIVLIQAERV